MLSEGDYFGELSYFDYTRRSASVVAITYGEVYVISCKELDRILESFPEYVSVLRREAAQHARVYDKGTFYTSPGVRRKSNLGGGKKVKSIEESEEQSKSITPWLETPGSRAPLGGISEDDELTEDELSLTPAVPVTKEDYSDDADLPGIVSSPARATGGSNKPMTDLEIQYKSASMYSTQLKKLYEQAMHQEKILAGHIQNERQKIQERMREEDDM